MRHVISAYLQIFIGIPALHSRWRGRHADPSFSHKWLTAFGKGKKKLRKEKEAMDALQ
jgi:hypothetical protein